MEEDLHILPSGYDNDLKTKYPVLYIQHGGGEDQRGWAVQGMTDLILDNLIAEGKAKPMLVVMETSAARKPGEPQLQMRPPAPAVNRPSTGNQPQQGASPNEFHLIHSRKLC